MRLVVTRLLCTNKHGLISFPLPPKTNPGSNLIYIVYGRNWKSYLNTGRRDFSVTIRLIDADFVSLSASQGRKRKT